MSATQRFIEDAIAGGCEINNFDVRLYPQIALLEPLAWQAVGKTRGWDDVVKSKPEYKRFIGKMWKIRWNLFVDHLADGKTIEEALTSLEDNK